MKKYIFLFFFTSIHFLNSYQDLDKNRIALLNTIQREAENLIWHETILTPNHLQLLLNYCCVSYAMMIAEHKLLQEAQFIFPMAWHMRYDNEEPIINTEHLLMLEKSCIRFSNLFNARAILRTAHEKFSTQLQHSENKPLYEIVQLMANHCTHLITYFANQEHTSIEQTLIESKTILSNAGSMISMTGGTCKSLHEGTYPLANQMATTKSLELIETALNVVPTIAKQTYEAIQATDLIASKAKDLQEFGALAFYTYYKVTHEGMKQRGIEDSFFGMLFENNIIISTDPKTRVLKEPIFDTNIPFFGHC